MDEVDHKKCDDLILTQIKANSVHHIYELLDKNIKWLSLDCFDTLIWRKSATPFDIFYNLQNKPTFNKYNITAKLRAEAEEAARNQLLFKSGITEVKLSEIYRAYFNELTHEEVRSLENEELENDMEFCYAYSPVTDLIRHAHQRGIKIIIASDTYYTTSQLQKLLNHCLPADVVKMISKVFCSCEYGKPKSAGLFDNILNHAKSTPDTILHLGDNALADYYSANKHGINAIHLLHHEDQMSEVIRLQAAAIGFMDSTTRHSRSLDFPMRGMLAYADIDSSDAVKMLAYSTLGPIMFAFAKFITNKIAEIKLRKENVKVLYLMRDGYLPFLSHREIDPENVGTCVRISRFASYASSFISKESIDKYLSLNISSLRFYDMCKQLLLPESISNKITDAVKSATDPIIEFVLQIRKPEITKLIIKQSGLYRKRLYKHLQSTANVNDDDTIIFVDLGYSGTTQNYLQSIFNKEHGIEIYGLYLIALGVPGWSQNRAGLIDPSSHDDRTLSSLVAYIALLEQLCTTDEPSVIDYDESGNPIFTAMQISKAQNVRLTEIQDATLQYIGDTRQFLNKSSLELTTQNLRDIATSALLRLLYFPTEQELNLLNSFKFDLNLGTKDIIDLFNIQKGLSSLNRRGLFFMERNLKSMRTNYPAELRAAGLDLSFMLLGQHRFNFDLRLSDISLRREKVGIIAISNITSASTNPTIAAIPTYDGYFSLIIPAGRNEFQIGIQFGLCYEWVQIEAADLIETTALLSSRESEFTYEVSSQLAMQDMVDHGNGLFECQAKSGLIVYIPDGTSVDTNYSLRIVFRPISKRENVQPDFGRYTLHSTT